MIPMSVIDPLFAKRQLLLLLSDRYQHPNGQVLFLSGVSCLNRYNNIDEINCWTTKHF